MENVDVSWKSAVPLHTSAIVWLDSALVVSVLMLGPVLSPFEPATLVARVWLKSTRVNALARSERMWSSRPITDCASENASTVCSGATASSACAAGVFRRFCWSRLVYETLTGLLAIWNSGARKKNVRSFVMGPPKVAPIWWSLASALLPNASSEVICSLRSRYDAEWWNAFVPDFVDMLMMPPVVRPNSAAKMFRVIWNSCSASMLKLGADPEPPLMLPVPQANVLL